MRFVSKSVLAIIGLGFLVYWNSLSNPFMWDDHLLIVDNPEIQKWSRLPQLFRENIGSYAINSPFYRPIQMLTYMTDHALWGPKPWGFHLTNLIVHLLAALALFAFVFKLCKDPKISFLSAAFFVIHPVHTEAVTYIAGRADSLALFFTLIALTFYLSFLERHKLLYILLSGLSFFLALLSKEHSMILPGIILMHWWAFSPKNCMKPLVAHVGVALAYLGLRYIGILGPILAYDGTHATLAERIPGVFAAFGQYIRLLFLPIDLHMGYGHKVFQFTEPHVILGLAAFVGIIVFTVLQKKKNSLRFFCLGFFFVTLLPVSNIWPLNAYMAEHWLYLPSVGFFVLIASYLPPFLENKGSRFFTITMILTVAGALSYMTVKQNNTWAEPVYFFKRIISHNPSFSDAYSSLAAYLSREGRYDEANDHYSQALLLRPNHPGSQYDMGTFMESQGKKAEAIVHYREALKIDPAHSGANNNLGVILSKEERHTEAIRHYLKALESRPDYPEAHNNLANSYLFSGEFVDAIIHYRKALDLMPDYEEALNNLGVALIEYRDHDAVIEHYSDPRVREPQSAHSLNGLAIVHAERGRFDEAEAFFKKALEIDPDHEGAMGNLEKLQGLKARSP